jgi:hypothetical protein
VTLDRDAGEQAALKLTINGNSATPIGAAGAGSVAFTVAGLDPEDIGTVTFTDANNNTVVVPVTGTLTSYTANLTSLTDGTIISSLQVKPDSASNTFTPVSGNSATLDQDSGEKAALKLTVNGATPIGNAVAGATPFLVAGLESDDNGTVSFSDGSHAPVVVNIANGVVAVSTVNVSGLNDGTITATLHLNNDTAGNSFTNVVTTATLDRDTGEQQALKLIVTNTAINAATSSAVSVTIGGLDSEDTGTVTFTDVNGRKVQVGVNLGFVTGS